MHIYLTELEEQVRREHRTDRHHRPPTPPRVPTRTRVAGTLRRVADRLEQ